MRRGWDFDYLTYKRKQLENKKKNCIDLDMSSLIDEEIQVCEIIITMLLFSNQETIYDEPSFKDFIDVVYQQKFSYEIPTSEAEMVEKLTSSFSQLPRLDVRKYEEKVSPSDAIAIVGDFIKDVFDKKHYRLYKNTVMSDYILFDKTADLSCATSLDGEIFLQISQTDNIEMLSSIAHESGHIYRMSNNDVLIQNSYGEYESFFYEFNLLLWLIKNNIYSNDAINRLKVLFDLIEKMLFMRYFINKYCLSQIKSPNKFKEIINKFQLKEKLNIKTDVEFFDLYYTVISFDLLTYLNSFMAVINNISDFDKYEQMIRSLKTGNENEVRKKVLNKNLGEYDSYLRFRNKIMNWKY